MLTCGKHLNLRLICEFSWINKKLNSSIFKILILSQFDQVGRIKGTILVTEASTSSTVKPKQRYQQT